MLTIKILGCVFEFLLWFFIVLGIFGEIRNARYQKLWHLKKSTIMRIDPAITHAELCEQYVMFCRKNGVKVDF